MFDLADQIVTEAAALHPTLATSLGVEGEHGRWGPSFGLEGVQATAELRGRFRSRVEEHLDDDSFEDRLAARVVLGSFDEADRSDEAGDHFRDLRHMASSFQRLRSTFDIMPSDDAGGREAIVSRLGSLSEALADYRGLLANGLSQGIAVSSRQAASVIAQARRLASSESSLAQVVEGLHGTAEHSAAVSALVDAKTAYGEFAAWLESDYLPHAQEADGVGLEVYLRSADRLVGLPVDPEEAYEWGWQELRRLMGEMSRTAERISPGVGVEGAIDRLENDRSETVGSTDELLRFVSETLEEAVGEMAGKHFDVPDLIKPLTVQLAPPGGPLGVYYLRPSEDFRRPGGVWYSLGDQEVFPLYQHRSTAYHEGFPGHHLQIATAMMKSDVISRFQRTMTWYPGYGEGWAMYAGVVMGELGYLDDPRHYMGMLAKQMYRTSRVLVDLGLHLGKRLSDGAPLGAGEEWSFDLACEFMRQYGFRTPQQAESEVLRYLGWPGQAIAYKLGEREILSIRSETRRRLGSRFDLAEFHSSLLGYGAMRLDLLREVVRQRLT